MNLYLATNIGEPPELHRAESMSEVVGRYAKRSSDTPPQHVYKICLPEGMNVDEVRVLDVSECDLELDEGETADQMEAENGEEVRNVYE